MPRPELDRRRTRGPIATLPLLVALVALVALLAVALTACSGRSSRARSDSSRTCRSERDRTATVNAMIAAVPDGGTVTFPRDACFHVDGTIDVVGRHNLTVDGRGTTFVRRVAVPGAFSPQWLVQGSTGITLRSVRIAGPKPDAAGFNHPYEGQPGIAIDNSRTVTVEQSTITAVWGDFVRISNITDGVNITGNQLVQAGRQGLAVVGGAHIVFDHNMVSGTGRFSIDLEPYAATPVHAVTITHNQLVHPRFGFVCATGYDPRCTRGPALYDVTVRDNVQEG